MRDILIRSWIKAFGHLLTPASKRFHAALTQPQQAQKTVQQRLIKQLNACEYGQLFNIRSAEDWHRLPIVSYEDLQPWIEHSTAHNSPLTPERILFYEPTSGSSGPVKQIPYTRSLRRSFNHLFCVWAHDLIRHGPKFSKGKLYFSISPNFNKTDSQGTTDDADYLDPWLRWLLKPFLVIAPPARSPEAFKENLSKTLLQTKDLEIISVWSPSFLTAQLDYIQAKLPSDIALSDRWLHLKLISCWDSATAADSADSLRQHFPNALVQGKGLLATEAPMTVPLIAAKGQVPLLDEVFFEFEDAQGDIYELHQLSEGETYEVIVSQMGGLYRYRMGDRVQATHYFRKTPCLKFVGRGEAVSDLVGEKLHIQFVSDVIDRLDLAGSQFQSLTPVLEPKAHYALLLDGAEAGREEIAQQLETLLCQSYHYQLARSLDQLAPARVVIWANIAEQLAAKKCESGQRWGDIKHLRLGSAIANL